MRYRMKSYCIDLRVLGEGVHFHRQCPDGATIIFFKCSNWNPWGGDEISHEVSPY